MKDHSHRKAIEKNKIFAEHKIQAERIRELESALGEFVDRTDKAVWPDQVPVYIEAFYDKCKQLLNHD